MPQAHPRHKPRTLPFHLAPQDLVEARRGRTWSPAWVKTLTPRHVVVQDPYTRERYTVPKTSGRLRCPSGERLIELVDQIHTSERARMALPPLPGPVIVHSSTKGAPRRVRKPRKRYRLAAYLEALRQLACIACGAPPRVDPHHDGDRGVGQTADDYDAIPLCRTCHDQITRTYCLGSLDRAATESLVLRTQNALLKAWIDKHEQPQEEVPEAEQRLLDVLNQAVAHG